MTAGSVVGLIGVKPGSGGALGGPDVDCFWLISRRLERPAIFRRL